MMQMQLSASSARSRSRRRAMPETSFDPAQLKAIVFDLDGTRIETRWSALDAGATVRRTRGAVR
jgi:hypothetical protein